MNKRDQAIVDWVKKNRPDLNINVHIMPAFDNQGLSCLMSMAFEAGRVFQKANPKLEMSPHVYLED
jgi:hypothetical protein